MIQFNAGQLVELAVRRQNINISELSRKMNINRRTLYNWFRQETLSPSVIYSISQAIGYDFSNEFPEQFFKTRSHSYKIGQRDDAYISAEDAKEYWMKKYISLLEDYKLLLEKSKTMKTTVMNDN